MANLLTKREHFKPFLYPWCYEYWEMQNKMHWMHTEVSLADDVKDWNHRLTPQEKNLLTQIFRFFTQGDIDVASGYLHKYIPIFGHVPEVAMMLSSFAAMESVHIAAYAALLETVGMPSVEYQAFSEYEAMKNKHKYLDSFGPYTGSQEDMFDIAKQLAVYSAFTEGMQLFSSFAILLNFPRFGKMRGMGQIVSWSVKDESLHVEAMTRLFREFISENPHLWTDQFKGQIYRISRDMIKLEDTFIDLAFEMGDVEGLDKVDLKCYIRYLTDLRLNQLGLKKNSEDERWKDDFGGTKYNPLPWIDDMTGGIEHTNFFENTPTAYSKGGLAGDWD